MSIILNSIVPVCALIAMGYGLKRSGFASREFFCVSDRLIYYIFFPAMLFWEIGRPAPTGDIPDWRLALASVSAVFCVSLLSLLYTKLTKAPDFAVGSFSQC